MNCFCMASSHQYEHSLRCSPSYQETIDRHDCFVFLERQSLKNHLRFKIMRNLHEISVLPFVYCESLGRFGFSIVKSESTLRRSL
ncbi:hypothetical protein EUGRSUZ_H03384 [Eucalyptus grandis]|uniref:Uncharacterized protein n=2 Tax=Eucalyptus grandis TaxID=71139 RepID=A0ACC3JXI2_EUCGR|nr:hypothetical protein EUGRSUZ_H03384 [Eucalyptus grandis]